MKILYVVGCLSGESKRYRVYNLIEELENYNIYGDLKGYIDNKLNDEEYILEYDLIVLVRVDYSNIIKNLISIAKSFCIPIIFDVDDLIFDEDIVSDVRAIESWSNDEKENYIKSLRSYNKVLIESDYISSSTEYICSYAKKFGKQGFVIPNGVNQRQIEIAQNLIDKDIEMNLLKKENIIIGYLSGSNTHQIDFEQVVPALNKIFDEYPNVFLKVIGYLDVDKYFIKHKNRVIKKDFVSWENLVIETSNIDINLAPLEKDNRFCNGKSELKYFEAGLVGVPTISTPTYTFSKCIIHEYNGLLAQNDDEWYRSIKDLIESSDLYKNISMSCKENVEEKYYPKIIGKIAKETYENIMKLYKTKRIDKNKLNISWIIPEPFKASGGHRNIFRTIKYLSSFGHNLKVYVISNFSKFKSDEELKSFVQENFMELDAEFVLGTSEIESCDVLFATHWSTAYIVEQNRYKALLNCYFIQDYEPFFYEMGYEYILAYNTYKMGFYHIASGPWCISLLKKEFGVDGNYFRFPIDRKIYFHNDNTTRNRNKTKIIFFARPDMPRRCYTLGVNALSIIKNKYPEVEIVFYGADKDKYRNIPFEFTNLGMLPTINDLGDLYRSADIGVVFSTTNPSLVPYEMMACGCAVIDLDFNDNLVNYGSEKNVMLAQAYPESVAKNIEKLINDKVLRNKLAINGMNYCDIFPSEEDMVKQIEGFIKSGLKNVL